MMAGLRGMTVLLAANIWLTACAQPLTEETAENFGLLASTAASFVGAPAELQWAALSGARENDRLCRYLTGQAYELGASNEKVQISALAAEQEGAGKALKSYVEALVEASRGGSLEALEKAKAGFNEGATSVLTEAKVSGTDVAAVLAGTSLILRAGESRRQARIREIMWDTVDTLAALEIVLRDDLSRVTRETRQAVTSWDRSVTCIMKKSRNKDSAIEIFGTYDGQRREMNKLLAAVENAPAAVQKLRFSHMVAAKEPAAFEEAIQTAAEALAELDAIRDALK